MNLTMKPNSPSADVGIRAPAALAFALAIFASPLLAADAPAVRVATPTRGDIHRFVTQPGTIRPLQQATLYARVPGYLKSIAVDKGDAVKTGALLAELEAPELLVDLARARGELAKAKADTARQPVQWPGASMAMSNWAKALTVSWITDSLAPDK